MGEDVFPDRSMEHRDKIAWMIETDGWAIEPVAADTTSDPPRAPYAYTIGVESSFSFPEIVVFGMTPANARGLLGLVVDCAREKIDVPIGPAFVGLLDSGLRCVLLPVDIDSHRNLFGAALDWNDGDDCAVVQLIWPDRNGWLPWEPGFEERLRLAQPVIGSLDGVG